MEEGKKNDQWSWRTGPLRGVVIGLAALALAVLIFSMGVRLGGARARFSYRWAENYHKNFGGPRGGFVENWRKFPAADFISGHGVFGEIIKIDDAGFVVKGRAEAEKAVTTTAGTVVERGRKTMAVADLKVGDSVVIIGESDEAGQIVAKLVRFFEDGQMAPPRGRGRLRGPLPGGSFFGR